MDQPRVVSVGEALAELFHQRELATDRDGCPPLDHLAQRLAIDVLHGDERLPLVLADVVDGDDVGMLKASGRARFAQKARAHLIVVDPEELEGDQAVDGGIERQIQRAHASLPETFADFVSTDDRGH